MTSLTPDAVRARLSKVRGPDLEGDIVSLGLVGEIAVRGGRVSFAITVPAARAAALEPLRAAAEKVVAGMEGVEEVFAVLTADDPAPKPAAPQAGPAPAPPPDLGLPRRAPSAPAPGGVPAKAAVPGIAAIIAVASGKGGVGKSTTSVNLALALQATGKRVGVLDADIYGPSMPRMLGVSDRPEARDGRLVPPKAFGLSVMSMGFLVDEDAPMIWRGPMVISAITQMLREVDWGDLDLLVVDMPPGTGDAQLTLAQQVPLAGAVIVSTPQDIALIDARKGLNMFRKVEVPILGIVENMSYFLCPDCGGRHDLFGHGGARAEAARLGVPFLGEVPLHMEIRRTSDGGTPVVVSDPAGVHARTYLEIAERVAGRLVLEG